MVMDKSRDTKLRGLAWSIADVQTGPSGLDLGIIHSKHVEMLQPYIKELEKILLNRVSISHLAMLEEAYSWGVDLRWQTSDS
jgi:hypothetical protein